jgi:predicted RNase H-like HicB family nuclease
MAYTVTAQWDEEAHVWVAHSEDVPGLATGADSYEALIGKLRVVVPELLEANGLLKPGAGDVDFAIVAERTEHVRRVA